MGLLACLLGCSDHTDFRREGRRWTYLGQEIAGADAGSFLVLDAHHARDARQAWYADTERRGQEYYLIRHVVIRPIEGVDAASFAALSAGYARDRARVYFEGLPFAGADPQSFRVLDADFTADRERAYFLRQPLPGSRGGAQVRLLDTFHLDDGSTIFYAARGASGAPPRVQAIDAAERASFEVLGAGWARDARQLYHSGRKRPGNPASFQALDRGYARSDLAVYHLDQTVQGADPASFEVLPLADTPDQADARDARRRYRGGEALPPAAAASAPAPKASSRRR